MNNENVYNRTRLIDYNWGKPANANVNNANSILIPSTLPKKVKGIWQKFKAYLTTRNENRLQRINEEIPVAEKNIEENRAFIDKYRDDTNERIVNTVTEVAEETVTLEEQLKKLENKRIKLERKAAGKKAKEDLSQYLTSLHLTSKQAMSLIPLEKLQEILNPIIAEQAAQQAGLSEEDAIKLGESIIGDDQPTVNAGESETPVPTVNVMPTYDNGNNLASNLAPQVQEAMKTQGAKPVDELIQSLKMTNQNASKLDEVLEELAKERLRNSELEKRIEEIKTIEKERDELRFSTKSYETTIQRMDEEIKGHIEKINGLQKENGNISAERDENAKKADEALKRAERAEQEAKEFESRAQVMEQKFLASEQEKNNIMLAGKSLSETIVKVGTNAGWDTAKYFPEIADFMNIDQPQVEQQQTR